MGGNKEPACQHAQLQNLITSQKNSVQFSCTGLFYSNVSAVGTEDSQQPNRVSTFLHAIREQPASNDNTGLNNQRLQSDATDGCESDHHCSGLKRGGATSQWWIDGVQGFAVLSCRGIFVFGWCTAEAACMIESCSYHKGHRQNAGIQHNLYTCCYYFNFCGSFCSDNFAA